MFASSKIHGEKTGLKGLQESIEESRMIQGCPSRLRYRVGGGKSPSPESEADPKQGVGDPPQGASLGSKTSPRRKMHKFGPDVTEHFRLGSGPWIRTCGRRVHSRSYISPEMNRVRGRLLTVL